MKSKIAYEELPKWKYRLYKTYKQKINIQGLNITLSSYGKVFGMIKKNMVTIKRGYAWDGPSGPTIDTKNFMRGSLIHDFLYQCIREGLLGKGYRKFADQLLRDMCREDGMSWFRASYIYLGVRFFAGFAVEPKQVILKEAP